MTSSSLAVSPAQLWAVLNASHSGVAMLVAVRVPETTGPIVDFRYRFANEAHARLTPFGYDKLAGKCVSELFPNLAQHPFFAQFHEAIRTQQPSESKHSYRDERVRGWFAVRVTPQDDDLIVTYDDITEAQTAQAEAEQRTQELRAIFDASLNSIIAMTALRDETDDIIDFSIDFANEAVRKSTFKTPDQIRGRQLLNVFPGNQENGFFDLYKRVVATGTPEQSTQFYRDAFGLEGWFEVSAVRLGKQQVVVTYNNVTGIKRQELDLQRTNDHLVQINDSALAAIASYTAIREKQADGTPGRIIDFSFDSFSRTAEEITGLHATDVVGGRMLQMFPTVGTSGLFDKWVQLVETGEALRFTDHYDGEGIEFWFDTKAVKSGDGFIQSYIDISNSVRYQQGLERANAVLRQANDNLQQFAFVASHDLQEPLRKIVTMSDLVTEKYAPVLPPEASDLLLRMRRAAQRMTALIKDLLAYSRLATPDFDRQPIALNPLVDAILADLELMISNRNATIDVGTLPTIEADARQVYQLVQNLLTNALKYVPSGTTPRIRVSSQPHTRESLAGQLDTGTSLTAAAYHELTISDNGIGFRPEYRDRIFGTFQRLHPINSPYEGTGIGLAIVKRVADNHEAIVVAESEEGQGATFRVFWPVSAA
jgi:signal transduction histidine kinase